MANTNEHISGKLLIVEDEFVIAQDLRRICRNLGYAVMGMAKSAKEALAKIEKETPDLVMLDINIIGDTNGIELAKIIRKKYSFPYIFVTSYSDTNTIKSMDATHPLGYILKPFDERDIRVALELAFTKVGREPLPNYTIKSPNKKAEDDSIIIGESKSLKTALKKVMQVASTDVTVLLSGETGTGKELFMQALHSSSTRAKKKLVKVNCAALPSDLIESVLFGHEKGSFTGATEKQTGKFELAEGGTLFLDEIGELPLSSQSKLLRALQEKEIEPIGSQQTKKVDVRIVAATNRNLAEEVQKGNFRADLFFRLNIFPIQIPALRDRGDDVIILAEHFLKLTASKFNKPVHSIEKQTRKNFSEYSWPGNVRELQHHIERGILLAEDSELVVELDLQCKVDNGLSDNSKFQLKSMEEIEREQIVKTLEHCNGKIRGAGGAAEILKLHPNTLDFRIKKLGIEKIKNYKTND